MNEPNIPAKGNTVRRFAARVGDFIYRYVPATSFFLFLIGILAAIVHITACLSPAFADQVNDTVAAALRFLLAQMTDIFPFSVGETLLLSMPFVLVLLILVAVHRAQDKQRFWRFMIAILSALALLYSLFVFTIGCGYRSHTLDKKLGLDSQKVSVTELYSTADILLHQTNAFAVDLVKEECGATVMPYTYAEMNDKLLAAYRTLGEKYPFIQQMDTRLKPVSVSEWMSYTHITGVYSYMTGEANINNVFPDYTIPFTAAHELAHQRGIARENEANFIAFLVCTSSDDPYIQYSGYMNMLEYVSSALYSASPEEYYRLAEGYSDTITGEMVAYSLFYEKYQDSVIGEISGSINDAYLQMQGTVGTRSYGMVVDLAVAYYRDQIQ